MERYSLEIYLSAFILAAAIWLARFFARTHKNASRCRRHQEIAGRTLQGCKALINDECHGLTSRASANVRLVRAFNIDNVFTTTNAEYAAAFKRKAESLINLSEQQWGEMAERVQVLARSSVAIQLTGGEAVNVARLVQTTTLRALLSVIFPEFPSSTSSERDLHKAAAVVAEKISALWKSSKQSPGPSSEAADLRILESAMGVLLPGSATSPARTNPLNLIIPAFETTWRLVFQCFLEVQFRNLERSKVYRALLRTYLHNPTAEVFKRRVDTDAGGVSLYDVVRETLRLYPPTKNIYRSGGKAEIGFIQRSAKFWGADAELFRPERWKSTCARDAAFLPFGSKPFSCPAKEPFAPRVTGLLVAGTLEVLLERGEWKATGDCGVGVPGALWNKRGEYEDLCIKLVDRGQKK